jgi:hypothetical protein
MCSGGRALCKLRGGSQLNDGHTNELMLHLHLYTLQPVSHTIRARWHSIIACTYPGHLKAPAYSAYLLLSGKASTAPLPPVRTQTCPANRGTAVIAFDIVILLPSARWLSAPMMARQKLRMSMLTLLAGVSAFKSSSLAV